MIGNGLAYVASLCGITFFLDDLSANIGLGIALTLIPGFFVLMMLRAIWVYLRDVDEAQRYFIMRSLIVGTFVILSLSGVWGLIELVVEDVPALPVFWIFPIFFFAFGLAGCFGPGRGMGIK